jgi:hypothetical protein
MRLSIGAGYDRGSIRGGQEEAQPVAREHTLLLGIWVNKGTGVNRTRPDETP